MLATQRTNDEPTHCDEAKEALERMDISKSIMDQDRIGVAYHEHGNILEKLGLGDEAQLSDNKADELSKTTGQSATVPPIPNETTPTSTSSPAAASNSTTFPDFTTICNKKTVVAALFTKDCPPLVRQYAFPGPDERLVSTRQLALCLALLQAPSSSLDCLTPEARDWLRAIEKNQVEKGRLTTLATDIVRALAQDQLKDRMAIAEVVCLAAVLEKADFRTLLSLLVNAIKDSLLLDVQALEGLAHLIQNAAPGYLDADDLVKILELLSTRLQETFQQSLQLIYELTITASHVLDAMADCNIQGLDRVKLHEPLLSYLEQLKADKDPYIVYQAAYAYQALLCVPDDEEPWQAALRRSRTTIKGVRGLTSAVNRLNITEFISGLSTIQEGFQGATQIFMLAPNAYSGVTALKESGQGLLEALKSGLSFSHKRIWYAALRGAESLIQNGELTKFKTLVCEAPCRRDLAFQWGICQLLGYLAEDPERDSGSRKDAIALLGEMYWNDEEWGHEPRIKQCILDILLQLLQIPENVSKESIKNSTEDLLKDLMADGDEKKQGLYLACIQDGPSLHSRKIATPLLDSSLLIDKVQIRSSIEPAIRRYQSRRHQEQEHHHAVYISPQAKETRESSDNDLFDLTTRVNEFIAGDNDAKVLLLLGDSGAGKSTFNLELEKSLWEVYNTEKKWIPIFVTLPAIDRPEKDLIAKQLQRYDVTEDQIRELKSYHQFVLICDGYDECQKKYNLYNDNRLNQPGEWNVKMVISCRSEFLGSDYRLFFQPGGRNDRKGTTQLQEAVIAPFSMTKISDYIRSYVSKYSSTGDTAWGADNYENAIKNIPNLQELVRNPFLLSLSLDVLPRLVDLSKDLTASTASRVILYDQFVEQWVERGQKRLIERSLTGDDHAAFEILSEDGFTRNAIGFVKDLAVAIFEKQDGKPVVDYSPIRDKASWKTEFFGHGDGKSLLRETCPLSRTGNQYRFIHRSVLEYGLARAVYEPHPLGAGLEDSVEKLSLQEANQDDTATFSDSPIFRKSFIHEPSIINFLSERVQQSAKFKDQLHLFIERSKMDDRFIQAAANAITILVRAGIRFNGADLKGIRVAGADLSGGEFDSANLQGADLRNTMLQNIWLRQADLSDSQMEGVVFGQLPYLEMENTAQQCLFSPDGLIMAVLVKDNSVNLYDIQTSSWSRVDFLGDASAVRNMQTGESGSGMNDRSDTASDHPDTMSDKHSTIHSTITCMAYSPCSSQIILGTKDGSVQLWVTRTGAVSSILSGHTGTIISVSCSPDGRQIASGSQDRTVRLWDVPTGALSHTLTGHTYWVNSVAYTPSGQQIASGSCDTTVRVWDARTGVLCFTLNGHTGWVRSVAYSPNGQLLASGSDDQTVRLWDAHSGDLYTVLSGHDGHVTSVVFSPNGQQIASSSWDRTVRQWDSQTGSLISVLSGHEHPVLSVSYSSSGQQIASGGIDSSVRLWHSHTRAQEFTLNCHTASVVSVVYSPNSRKIVSGSEDKTVRTWDEQTGTPSISMNGHIFGVMCVAISPNGKQIASSSRDRTVRLWNAQTGALRHTLAGHTGWVTCVACSPDGLQIASGSWDKTVRLWDALTGALIHILSGHTNWLYSVAYSPDGKQIVSGGDTTVKLWDTVTGTLSQTLSGHTSRVFSVIYSPSGQQIASGSDGGTVRLWNTQTGALFSTFTGHNGPVTSVAYSPSSELIASSSQDETVRLWSPDSGQCLFVLSGFHGAVNSIAWRNDTTFVIGCDDESVSTWGIAKDESEIQVCLNWRSGPKQLMLSNASIQGVQGLSEVDTRLFQQHQEAVDSWYDTS